VRGRCTFAALSLPRGQRRRRRKITNLFGSGQFDWTVELLRVEVLLRICLPVVYLEAREKQY
jgi:hypothetical protein